MACACALDGRVKDLVEILPHFNDKENVQTEDYLLLPRTPRPIKDTSMRRVRGVSALRSISDNVQSRLPREGQPPSNCVLDPRDLECSEADTRSLSNTESLRAALQHVSTQKSQSRERAKASHQEPASMDFRWQELIQNADTFGTDTFSYLFDSCLTESDLASQDQSAAQGGSQGASPAIDISTSKTSNNPGWLAINSAYRFSEAATDLPTAPAESPPSRPFEVAPSICQYHSSQSVIEVERMNVVTSELSSHAQVSPRWFEVSHDCVKKNDLRVAQDLSENDPFILQAVTGVALGRKFREDASRWWRRVVEPSTSVYATIVL